jgi:glycosyltransferase involved in cell wall biosynthesis
MMILSLIVGGFALIQFSVALSNAIFRTNILIGLPTSDSLISILIPARNEEDNIARLLSDLVESKDANMEILVLDDDSDDQTAAVVAQFAKDDSRIKLIQSTNLPKGWLGKNFACYSLSHQARGNHFLFLDADVRIKPGFIRSAVDWMHKKNLGLLTIFPKQEMHGIGERITVPIMNYILLTLLPLPLVQRLKFASLAAANGQFMLFNSATYKLLNPHEKEKGNKVEDIAIARYYKSAKVSIACLLGDGSIRCRMYKGYKDSIKGFSKNLTEFFGGSFVVTMLFWFITTWGFIPIFISFGIKLSMAYLVILIITRVLVSIASNQNILNNIIYLIPQQLNIGIILILAFRSKFFTGFLWKGRDIG